MRETETEINRERWRENLYSKIMSVRETKTEINREGQRVNLQSMSETETEIERGGDFMLLFYFFLQSVNQDKKPGILLE